MGSSHTKNKNVGMFVEINKPYYVAGEYVEGIVHLNIQKEAQYENLIVRVVGEEYIRWTEGGGNNRNRRVYRNQYENYNSCFTLMNFNGMINQGQYSFSFALLLPVMMSGSYTYSDDCYIQYFLRAELTHLNGWNETQYYQVHLNIMEPPHMPISQVSNFQQIQSKCCRCCINYGVIGVTLNSETNFVRNGDKLRIGGNVNNALGNENIRMEAVLEMHRVMISSGGRKKDIIDSNYNLGYANMVKKGEVKEFDF